MLQDVCVRRLYEMFVITAKGKIDNASASCAWRSCTGIARQVKTSCACSNKNACGNSIVVSFQVSAIGGKPTREESRGAITTIHWSASRRAKLTQHSAYVPLLGSGTYWPRWKSSACSRRNRSTRWVKNNFSRPSGHNCTSSPGVAAPVDLSRSRRRM